MKNNFLDRILSVLFYWSAGLLGIIYLVFAYMTKKTISSFALFNIYQSLFISVFLFILSFVYGIFINLISVIPFAGKFVLLADNFIFREDYIFGCTIAGFVLLIFSFYLAVCCLMYKKPYIPCISDIVKANFGG